MITFIKNCFRTFRKYWKFVVKKLMMVLSSLLLSIVYFGVIGVVFIVNVISKKDLLDKNLQDRDSFWHDKEHIAVDFERCKRQF